MVLAFDFPARTLLGELPGNLRCLGGQFAALGSGMVAGGGLGPVDWFLIAAIPLAGVVIAMLTARLTVLGALRKML